MASLRKLLEKTPVEALLTASQIIEIPSTDSVPDAFKKLIEAEILSAPVFDAESKQYTGFLDLRDLVSWAVFLFDEQADDESLDIINAGPRFFKHFSDGINVKYLSRRNMFKSVRQGAPLLDVAKQMRLGVKRVPVLNAEGRVSGIVSQSALNRFLYENTKALMGDTSISLSTLTIGQHPVLSASFSTPAIEVFRLMDNKHISGVAVVDGSGVITANTSSRDLKLFLRNPRRGILSLPVAEFLSQLRQAGTDTAAVVTCHDTETLAQAMGKIASTNVHRIYVLDPKEAVQRVITLTDIMKYIA
jgi:CBS domain-containing protein